MHLLSRQRACRVAGGMLARPTAVRRHDALLVYKTLLSRLQLIKALESSAVASTSIEGVDKLEIHRILTAAAFASNDCLQE